MLAHPTGRLLLKREPYAVDIPAIIEAAAETGTWIEINAAPKRLDLDWRWWPLAKEKGVKCVINPDAHRTERLQDLWFGIGVARKGWLTKADVMNCLPVTKIEKELKRINTATGVRALNSNTIGAQNTATGVNALFSNTTASYNTANGTSALFHNTTGSQNTATGVNALSNNSTGNANTANGVNTLFRNTDGTLNTATGVQALFNNKTGGNNTASGYHALFSNTTGQFNNAVGANALPANVDGVSNNALGESALFSNIHGGSNTAVGDRALANNDSTGNSNAKTALGAEAGSNFVDGEFNIYIGAQVLARAPDEAKFIRIGNVTSFNFPYDSFIAGIIKPPVDAGTATTQFSSMAMASSAQSPSTPMDTR